MVDKSTIQFATSKEFQPVTIDMNVAKKVMKGMTDDQQLFVEQLLNKLKLEQKMRLMGEMQHEQMVSKMTVTQQQLEQ